MPNDVLVACHKLVKTYSQASGQVRALKGVDCRFRRGALTAVVGPSGSGKSSLLRLIGAMDRPTSGEIEIDGTRIDSASSGELRRLRRDAVGYVFQRPSDNFVSYLTVAEHMRVAERRAAVQRLDSARLLDDLGIGHRIDWLPYELSGGEQQRAAFAQIIVGGPRFIVADEPTAELDSTSAKIVLDVVHQLVTDGVTFVIATHDPNVIAVADEVIELDHGLIKHEARAMAPPGRMFQQSLGRQAAERAVADVRGVTKQFHRGDETVHALEDVSVTLSAGEVLGLVGRSGSGKTTLLSILAGWEQPDAGQVLWTDNMGGPMPAWRDIAVVPQKLGLIEELSVRENIAYPARLAGKLDETSDFVEDLLIDLGLDQLAGRVPRETSVGEQQRTALARALVLSPRVLLADEPSGHQDRGWTEGVFKAIERAGARGTCCVIATHNEEVVPHLSRVLHMSDGRIVDEG